MTKNPAFFYEFWKLLAARLIRNSGWKLMIFDENKAQKRKFPKALFWSTNYYFFGAAMAFKWCNPLKEPRLNCSDDVDRRTGEVVMTMWRHNVKKAKGVILHWHQWDFWIGQLKNAKLCLYFISRWSMGQKTWKTIGFETISAGNVTLPRQNHQ